MKRRKIVELAIRKVKIEEKQLAKDCSLKEWKL